MKKEREKNMRELTMNYGPVFTVNDKQFIAETTMDKDLTMSYNYLKVRVPYTRVHLIEGYGSTWTIWRP